MGFPAAGSEPRLLSTHPFLPRDPFFLSLHSSFVLFVSSDDGMTLVWGFQRLLSAEPLYMPQLPGNPRFAHFPWGVWRLGTLKKRGDRGMEVSARVYKYLWTDFEYWYGEWDMKKQIFFGYLKENLH